MKKVIIFCLLVASTNTFARELINYEEVKLVITGGRPIRIAINFDKCKPSSSVKELPSFGLGAFSPNEITVEANGLIKASLLHFTINDHHFPGKPIYQFAEYNITQDNMINLTTQALDAVTFTPLSNGFTFNCKIVIAARIYGDLPPINRAESKGATINQ